MPARTTLGGAAVVVAAVVAVYARAAGSDLFADDFQWLVGAQLFDPARLVDLAQRDHFYRPVVETYFPAALAVCGRAVPCFHWFSIGLHAATCLLVAGMVGAISGARTLGLLAGVLLAVQPGPVEAVIWISAVGELFATAFFVLTVWLFWRASLTQHRGAYAAACLSFVASLLSHESGVMQLPILALGAWLLPLAPAVGAAPPLARRLLMLTPCVVAVAAYGAVAYVINSRNYVVTEGLYTVGPHIISNVLGALVTFAVARRELMSLIVVALLAAWAALLAPPRARFYALWTLVTLLPFAGFRDGLSSRYLYLPAVGFAALAAELLWHGRLLLARWPRAGVAVWLMLGIGLTGRSAAFAVKNVRTWEDASAPYRDYTARVRALHPSPPAGARIEVPPPPLGMPPHYVPPMLQWEYRDLALTVVVQAP